MRWLAIALFAWNVHAELTVFAGVNVVPMDAERVLLGQTVVIDGAQVVAVGPVDEVAIPDGARARRPRARAAHPGVEHAPHRRAPAEPVLLAPRDERAERRGRRRRTSRARGDLDQG